MSTCLTVECYSGHTYAQEPRAFRWLGRRYEVTEILSAWREPSGPVFKVRTGEASVWRLAYDELSRAWDLQAWT